MNFYDFHIGDYASRTAHLEPLEDIAYRRMLDLYYMRECPLPADVAEIARLIRMRDNAEEISAVLREFFEDMDGEGWAHSKCDEVIAKTQEKSGKASKSAKLRWDKIKADAEAMRTHSERSKDALQSQCEGNAPTTHYPLPITQANACVADKPPEPKRKRGSKCPPEDFEVTQEMAQWALMECPGVDVLSQTRAFRDYEFAKSYTDWVKTWRNWIRRAHTNAPNARGSPSRPPTQAAMTMAQACPSLAAPHLKHLVPAPQTDFIEANHAATLFLG